VWTRWCNCGETLSASAQTNAAKTQVAINVRPWFLERVNVLIAQRPCSRVAARARNFCEFDTPCSGLRTQRWENSLLLFSGTSRCRFYNLSRTDLILKVIYECRMLSRVVEKFKNQKLVWVTDVQAVLDVAGEKR
jgi:hypothetical protein